MVSFPSRFNSPTSFSSPPKAGNQAALSWTKTVPAFKSKPRQEEETNMITFFLWTWHRASVCLYSNPRGITGEGMGAPRSCLRSNTVKIRLDQISLSPWLEACHGTDAGLGSEQHQVPILLGLIVSREDKVARDEPEGQRWHGQTRKTQQVGGLLGQGHLGRSWARRVCEPSGQGTQGPSSGLSAPPHVC